MYDGGGENAAYVRCTMYDVRCTIAEFARFARGSGAEARRMHEAVRGAWRRFRGCLSCWIVLQSGRARQGKRIKKCVCHVRFTMYDVRFINNVRVAQILFGSLTYAEIPLDPSL